MQHAPDLRKLARVAFGHKVALVGAVVEQALVGQHVQGFAQRDAADGQLQGHFFLPDLLARVELAVEDHVFDLAQRTPHGALGLAAAVFGLWGLFKCHVDWHLT